MLANSIRVLFWTFLAIKVQSQCPTPSWGYTEENGPLTPCWDVCQGGGSLQSPIDIPHYHELEKEEKWLPFQWINYHEHAEDWQMMNTGHTASIKVHPEDCKGYPRVFQGGLPATYQLNEIHFKWGSWHHRGSEHTIHGERYSAEIQMVHTSEKCGREIPEAFNACTANDAAFGVLSVLITVGDHYNEAFEPIIKALHKAKRQGDVAYVKPIRPIDLLPSDTDKFYRYKGSFTTPTLNLEGVGEIPVGCSENVIWTVFKEPLRISYRQLKRFWKLRTNTGSLPDQHLLNNFRPNQTLNGRMVTYADLEFECKIEDEWRHDLVCDMDFMESRKAMGFVDASHHCMGNDYERTPLVGLIPVSRLRCLRNSFEYHPNYQRQPETEFCGRFFRVNAIKNRDGTWREFGSGNPILFHHFPAFRPEHGHPGDTLIWDAYENRLIIASPDTKHQALCYKQYDKGCRNCVGHNSQHECGDAGDCQDNICHCDVGFRGKGCQLGPIPDKDVILIGTYSARWNTKQESTEFATCLIQPFKDLSPTAETEMICEYIFGKGVCCLGEPSLGLSRFESTRGVTDICAFYDCQHQNWTIIHDFPLPLLYTASSVLKKDQKDYGLLVTGGASSETMVRNSLYLMQDHFRWTELNTVMPSTRLAHCMVQINDCEVALIGGVDGFDETTIIEIDIYNFQENTWREGPKMTNGMINPACGLVTDRIYFKDKVIIGCSEDYNMVDVWDLSEGQIYSSPHSCPTATTYGRGNFEKLDDETLVLTNTFSGDIYIFTDGYGFERATSMGAEPTLYGGTSFVAPSGFATCKNSLID